MSLCHYGAIQVEKLQHINFASQRITLTIKEDSHLVPYHDNDVNRNPMQALADGFNLMLQQSTVTCSTVAHNGIPWLFLVADLQHCRQGFR